jgi:DNA-directed RNA polymerase subunit RPC12/RpoP
MTGSGRGDLAEELQKIYDSEINVRISWLWDGGIEVWIGDDMNGYLAQDSVSSAAEIVPWFQEAIAHFYPGSTYARDLPQGVKERAKSRIFIPPQAGAQVRCPKCGAPHAAPPGMTELIGFTCPHCGSAVRVGPPKVQ